MNADLISLIIFPGGFFALLFSLFLVSFERIIVARLQARVGPPVYQNIIDVIKLFNKEIMIPKTSQKFVFFIAPVLAMSAMFAILYILPISGVYKGANFNNDFLVVIYLMALSLISYAMAGGSSNSPYGAVSVSRMITLAFAYELVFIVISVSVAVASGDGNVSFSLSNIVKYQQLNHSFIFDIKFWPAILAYFIFALAALDIPPFHITKNDSDIMEGFMLEYSGALLAFIEISKALKMLVIIMLFHIFFLSGIVTGSILLNFLIFIAESIIMLMIFAFIHAVLASFRVDQAFKFLLTVPTALAFITLVLVLI